PFFCTTPALLLMHMPRRSGGRLRRLLLLAVAALGCHHAVAADINIAPAPETVAVSERGRITLIEENDALLPAQTDRWYTQGFALSYLSAPVAGPAFAWFFPSTWLRPEAPSSYRFEIIFGQSIFTPANLRINPPDPTD